MCMIALRPTANGRGGHIPNAVIDTAMTRHPDGYGLMWRDAKGLHTECYAPSARKGFRKALKALDRSGDEYAVHFRFATSGPKNSDMAHPYTYMDPDPKVGMVALMHNGVIDLKHDRALESDTSAFVRLVLAELPSRWWASDALVYLVGQAIGYSKFVIMTKDETVNLHDSRGEWDNGLWYSSDHKPSKWTSYKVTGTTMGRSDGKGGTSYASPATKALTAVTHIRGGKPVTLCEHGVAYNVACEKCDRTWPDVRTALLLKADDAASNGDDAMTDEEIADWVAQDKAWMAYSDEHGLTNTSLPSSARSSAAALGLIASADAVIRAIDRPMQFSHSGHMLTAIKDINLDGGDLDYEDAVICDVCGTTGSVYVIDGGHFIDMAHMYGSDMDNEDEDALVNSFSAAEVIATALS